LLRQRTETTKFSETKLAVRFRIPKKTRSFEKSSKKKIRDEEKPIGPKQSPSRGESTLVLKTDLDGKKVSKDEWKSQK